MVTEFTLPNGVSVTPCVSLQTQTCIYRFACVLSVFLFCRENTIGVLQALLLDLLAKRAELLLQSIEVEVTGIVSK